MESQFVLGSYSHQTAAPHHTTYDDARLNSSSSHVKTGRKCRHIFACIYVKYALYVNNLKYI